MDRLRRGISEAEWCLLKGKIHIVQWLSCTTNSVTKPVGSHFPPDWLIFWLRQQTIDVRCRRDGRVADKDFTAKTSTRHARYSFLTPSHPLSYKMVVEYGQLTIFIGSTSASSTSSTTCSSFNTTWGEALMRCGLYTILILTVIAKTLGREDLRQWTCSSSPISETSENVSWLFLS